MGQNNLDTFVLILYVGIIVFFIYRLFKNQKNKGLLTGEVFEFSRDTSSFEKILFAVLVVTAVVNLVVGLREGNNRVVLTAAIMMVLAIVFAIASKNKLYIGENGILANSNFYDFKSLKKWGFDKEKGDLILQVKKDKQVSNEIIKVKKDDIEEVNTLIRRYKLNK